MKNILAVVATLIIVLGFSNCKTVKMVKDPTLASPKAVLSKGSCFGDCPVYTLTLYNTGLMKFNGVRYTHMDGKHEYQLEEATYVELIKAFEKANLWQYEDVYNMDIQDLPAVTLNYSDDDNIKTIKGKTEIPEPVLQLVGMLDSLTHLDNWLMVEAPPEKPVDKSAIIDDEIIIKGNGQLILVRWLKKYKKYGLRIGKRLGPESEYWMVKFNKELIEPAEMLQMIKEDPAIDEAEFNKKIQHRE